MPANKTQSDGPSPRRAGATKPGTSSSTGAGASAAETTAADTTASRTAGTKAAATKAPAGTKPAAGTKAAAVTRPAATKATGTKATGTKAGASRPGTKPTGNRASAARAARAAAVSSTGTRSRPKSLAVKRRTPWGLIITCVLVVVFAAAVIGYAVSRPKKVSADNAPYVRNEIAAAKAINGVIFKKEINHTHVTSLVKYDMSPPIGGNHSQVWADCSGTVYPKQIANENAVHPLEHGAVWITYRPGLDAASIATLSKLVTGQNYTLMTPYAGLKTPISLQAWNYQLFVKSASDPRIAAFIKALRNNPGTTPEYPGNCSNPTFKTNPSTPGHPIYQ
jgi:hypothetical protein